MVKLNRTQRRERASIAAVLALAEQVNDLARKVPNENSIMEMVLRSRGEQGDRMEKLIRDVIRVCRMLVEKGLISQEDLNRATDANT